MSTRTNQVSNKKPFCKVCQDAGKPESEYTSHYVRSMPDKSGKTNVTCPTLLATECRYCYELGHTTKFCPVIEANKKAEEKAEDQRIVIQKINNILKYWPHDTFTNSVKQQVVSGRTNLSSGQIELIEKKIEEAEEQRITIQQIDVVLLCWSSNTTAQGIKQWIDSGHTSLTSKQIAAIKNMHKSLNPIDAKKALESL